MIDVLPRWRFAQASQRPQPKPTLPPATTFASAVASIPQPLDFFTSNMHRHPEIFRSGLLGFSAYVIHDPAHIHHVLSANAMNYVKFEKYRYLRFLGGNGLVTNDGKSWLQQRRLIQPAFNRAAIERACRVMCEDTAALVRRLSQQNEQVLDISEVMGELTIGITARTLFGSDVGQHVPTIRTQLDFAQRMGNILLRIPLPLYRAVPYLPVFNRVLKCNAILRGIVQEMIDARRTSQRKPDDLLNDLMAARDDESQKGMTDTQLLDEVLTLLLAGHETTLLALTWAFYLLAKHPAAFERLREEALAFYPEEGLDTAGLEKLVWTKAVAREAMRLYPPAYIIGRQALADDKLGPYHVPAGKNVMINIYGLHRHPKYWDAPNEFRPERMLDPAASDPNRYAYLPFGAGPRACIGSRFSIVEMQIILASFARAFRFERTSNAEVQPAPLFTLKPGRPIHLRLHRQPGNKTSS